MNLALLLGAALWHGADMPVTDRVVPPEWAPHAALWVGWPRLPEEWGAAFVGARAEIAGFIRAASRFVPIKIACGSDEAETSAAAAVEGCGQIERVPTGDIWLRDTGAIFARLGQARGALCFQFNGWGGKFVMPGDRETAMAMARVEGAAACTHDFVLEGGAIDLDGAGRVLTTRQCLLNPNRNPNWTRQTAEDALRTAFGVDQVVWLGDGLRNDHTDGHVDNIARFIAPGHVVCQAPSGSDDPNADIYAEIEADLRAAGLTVSPVASPGRIETDTGEVVPASHMNFVLTNGALLLPTYESVYSQQAIEQLMQLCPGREIVALPARHILAGGGSFHCMTREVPHFELGE